MHLSTGGSHSHHDPIEVESKSSVGLSTCNFRCCQTSLQYNQHQGPKMYSQFRCVPSCEYSSTENVVPYQLIFSFHLDNIRRTPIGSLTRRQTHLGCQALVILLRTCTLHHIPQGDEIPTSHSCRQCYKALSTRRFALFATRPHPSVAMAAMVPSIDLTLV